MTVEGITKIVRLSDETLKPARSMRITNDFDTIVARAKQDEKISNGEHSQALGDFAARDANVWMIAQHSRRGLKAGY